MTDFDYGAAYDALEKIKHTMPPEIYEQMCQRIMLDKESMRAEIEQEVRAELEPEYEMDPVDGYEPEFYMQSEHSVTLGSGEHEKTLKIRYLNMDDLDYLSGLVPDIWQYVAKRGKQSLKKTGFSRFLGLVFTAARRDRIGGKPSPFSMHVFNAMAYCLSNPSTGETVTPSFLRACQPSQVVQALRKVVEVNQDFFPELLAELPGGMKRELNTLIGNATSFIKQIAEKSTVLQELTNGVGGIKISGGKNLETSSALSTDGQTNTSENSPSPTPTDESNQSTSEGTKKDISTGKQNRKQNATPKKKNT